MKYLKYILIITAILTLAFSTCLAASEVVLKKVHSIGIDDTENPEDEPYILFQIVDLDVASNGDVYILDHKAQHIRVYNPQGKFVRTILKKGVGPDEIDRAIVFSINPFNNNLYVIQSFGFIFKAFTLEGQPLQVYNLGAQHYHQFSFLDKKRIISVSTSQKEGVIPNFDLINLETKKVEKSFGKIDANIGLRRTQRLCIDHKNEKLWTVSPETLELKAIDLKTFNEVEIYPLPSYFKKNYLHFFPVQGGHALQGIFYTQTLAAVVNGDVYVVATAQDYEKIKKNKEAKLLSSKSSLFVLQNKKLEKVQDLPDCDDMQPIAIKGKRFYFYQNDPFPRVVIMELKEM